MITNGYKIERFDDIEEDGDEDVFNPLQNQNLPPTDFFEINSNKVMRMEEDPHHKNATATIDDDSTTRDCNRLHLYFFIFVVNLLYMCSGQCYVWTSPTLPYLLSSDSFLPVTSDEASVIASVFVFGGVLGALLMRPLADYLGRRWTIVLVALAILISWVMLGLATDVRVIYFGRLISGVAVGVAYSIGPIFTAEIADDSIRGALNSIPLFSRSCGYVFIYAIGPYVSYHRLVIVSAVCPLVCVLLAPLIVESPYHLVAQGRLGLAVKTIQGLRGNKSQPAAEKEVDAIKDYINQTTRDKKSVVDLFTTVGNIRALYISGGLLAIQQLCGVTVLLLYTEPIFLLAGTRISASLSALLFGSTMMVSALVVPPFIKRYGFIRPMIVSAFGCSIFVGLLGLFFFLQYLQIEMSYLNWLPITSLFFYTISYTIGIGTLPWAVMGEMFPSNTKSLAAGILTSFNFLLGFLTAVLFNQMNAWVGVYWSFWMYAAFCFSAAPFTYYLMPDTQGLSLDQIQHLVNQPWSTRWKR